VVDQQDQAQPHQRDKPIHIPAYMVEMISRFREAREQFLETEGRVPTIEDIAERLEMSISKVKHIRSAVRAVSTPSNDNDSINGVSLTEGLPDDRTPSPENALFVETQSAMILDMLSELDERESKILRLRYGLGGEEPLTLKEIGAAINLTRERVRQIECEALRKLEICLKD
jgi:RNA polymerase primary sigma factor